MAKLEEIMEVPEKVTAEAKGSVLTVKGPKGEITRDFFVENLSISADLGKITLSAPKNTKRERKIAGSFKAHIQNIFKGVVDGHKSRMKILSGHFPMTVSVNGREFTVKNFFGEKTARKLILPEGVDVKVEGNDIDIESCDKELIGMVTGSIEKLTRRTKFDRRIFQDGLVIVMEKTK